MQEKMKRKKRKREKEKKVFTQQAIATYIKPTFHYLHYGVQSR
jgi:hypothetical protein